jgi:hypothetical protein
MLEAVVVVEVTHSHHQTPQRRVVLVVQMLVELVVEIPSQMELLVLLPQVAVVVEVHHLRVILVVPVVAVLSFSNGHNKWQLVEDLMVA